MPLQNIAAVCLEADIDIPQIAAIKEILADPEKFAAAAAAAAAPAASDAPKEEEKEAAKEESEEESDDDMGFGLFDWFIFLEVLERYTPSINPWILSSVFTYSYDIL